jgi:FMN phosphatase YigB (HAD superfamily)
MTLTVLFDLDDTLLNTNMGEFLPAYFKGLGDALAPIGSEKIITKQIQAAVEEMVANNDPSKLLKHVFANNFYQNLGTTELECEAALLKFYAVEFPKLQALVTVKPEAVSLVQWLKSQGMSLAIATNPLFPETATRQRIAWAGLDPIDFKFFSTYDNFHFTKPNLCYFAEVIGRLGWPEEPIVMIGDNITLDLLPAEAMGIKTFWVNPQVNMQARAQGTLSTVKTFLSQVNNSEEVFTLSTKPEVLIAVLRSTPAVLNTWLEIYDRQTLHQQTTRNEWSANQVFWHLADFEKRVFLPQWRMLLENPDQIIPQVETYRWAEQRDYKSRDPLEACHRFLNSRMTTLKIVETLQKKGYFEFATHHPLFREAKISKLVAFSVQHDRLHLRQCAEALKI